MRLTASGEFRRPIKHRLPVRVHIGTAEVMGTVSLLDCDRVEPGQWSFAQLFLEEPATSVWGQPFVLRDSSAEHTLGGRQVLQPVAVKVRRRHLESLEQIENLWSPEAAMRALAATWFAGFSGLAAADLLRNAGLAPDRVEALVAELRADARIVEMALPHRRVMLHAERSVFRELVNAVTPDVPRLGRDDLDYDEGWRP